MTVHFDDPDVAREVGAAFADYERALMAYDVAAHVSFQEAVER